MIAWNEFQCMLSRCPSREPDRGPTSSSRILLFWFSVNMRGVLAEGDSALRAGIFKASGSIGPMGSV